MGILSASKIIGFALIALFAAWAVAALFGVMGQRKLFYEQGTEELYDYWMPRMCWERGYVGHPRAISVRPFCIRFTVYDQ